MGAISNMYSPGIKCDERTDLKYSNHVHTEHKKVFSKQSLSFVHKNSWTDYIFNINMLENKYSKSDM